MAPHVSLGQTKHVGKNLVIINLFYVGLILIYCILHAGLLNLMVFLGMLVVANLMGMLIK